MNTSTQARRLARSTIVATLLALGLACWQEHGAAFTSCYKLFGGFDVVDGCPSGHYVITLRALASLPGVVSHMSGNAQLRLASEVEGVDYEETTVGLIRVLRILGVEAPPLLVPYAALVPSAAYAHEHHFDRPLNKADVDAFHDSWLYLWSRRERVIALLKAPGQEGCRNTGKALAELGKALHVLQDAYSHSNYVDDVIPLDANSREIINGALQSDPAEFLPFVQLPPGLKLTLYDRDPPSYDPENPEGTCVANDPHVGYCHRYWSKDSPGKNPDPQFPTPYSAAEAAALTATGAFIQEIVMAVGVDTWNADMETFGTSFACTPPESCPMGVGGRDCHGPNGRPATRDAQSVTSGDPNDKAGSTGAGALRYISGTTPLRYAIEFSNEPTASAAAQRVVVTDPLDAEHEDLTTLSFGPISIVDRTFTTPAGPDDFSTIVDLRPANDLLVRIGASLNLATSTVTWTLQSLDPATQQPPTDPLAGFLPPGTGGSLFFTVMPRAGAPTGTQIQNQATIVFDTNAPMSTPAWINTIDAASPVSRVLPLPAREFAADFLLQWNGTDTGSGIQAFTIYVSDNGAAFTTFLSNTTATSATFNGKPGHTYGFFSVAKDAVGNVEPGKASAEATTVVTLDATPPGTTAVASPLPNAAGWNSSNVTVTLSAADNADGSGVAHVTYGATGAQPMPATTVAGALATLSLVSEGTTTLTFFADDNAGNVEPTKSSTLRLDTTPPRVRPPANQAVRQTAPDGAIVNYPPPAIVETGSGIASSGCAPASGSTFPPGTSLVTCTASDVAGNSASATFTVTVTPAPATTPDGRISGLGRVDQGRQHHHFAFRVTQRHERDHGRFEYWMNDRRHRFEATTIADAIFSDTPGSQPGHGHAPAVDTVRFTGIGKWNGRPGYRFEALAADRGEPGRHRDTLSLIIKDPHGAIVADISGSLAEGNIESSRLRP